MKLCVIGNPNSLHTHRWISYFVRREYQVHLIGQRVPKRPVPAGVIFHDLTRLTRIRKLRFLIWALVIRRWVRQIQPDLLHAHGVASSGWLGAAAGFHPLLITAHGSDLLLLEQRSWFHRQLSLWALKKADYITCVSQDLAQKARVLGIEPERLETVYLGVDTEVFHPETIRSRLNLGPGPVVLSIRATKPIYNPLDIAQAIPLVCQQVPLARFVILTYNADPTLLAQFQSIVQRGGVATAVQYVGELADDHAIADYYRAADIAISIPSSDGTPKSVQEAMACGTPVIVSDVPSLHEWVKHEREGLFVPVGDVKAIGAAMVRLLTDNTLCHKLGANSARSIRQRADSKVWMHRSEEIYRRLLEEH